MRQYVASSAVDAHGLLTVRGKDYRYMRQVLRLAVGDMVQVRLSDGALQPMTVCKTDERERCMVLQCCASLPADGTDGTALSGELPRVHTLPELWLFQFVAKSAKMEQIVRQATECGVHTIVPVLGAFSQDGGAEKNFRSERLLRIIKEARQQSGSATATRILDAVSVEQAIALWHDYCAARLDDSAEDGAGKTGSARDSFAAVLYERTEHTVPLHAAVAQKTVLRAALAVGAEGGIAPAEIALLQAGGFVPIHFETNILRCETAALYGIAALQNAITEKNVWQCSE